MKKFLLGLAAGFLLAGLAGVIAFFAMARIGDRRADIPDGGTLVLRIGGEIPELAPMEVPLPMFESNAPVTLLEHWNILLQAGRDSRIKGIVVIPQGISAGWAKMQELREALIRFKKTGKPVIAFLRTPRAREYYLATAADQVFLAPGDYLDVKGMRAELSYYRDTLSKLGVQFEIEHAGKYKDAMDSFTEDRMSPATREVMNSVLDDLYGHLVSTFASGRGKTPEQIRAAIDEGPFLGKRALELGLVDGLHFEDEVFDKMKARLGQKELRKVSHRDYVHARADSGGRGPQAAVLVAQGEILRGEGGGEDTIRSGTFGSLVRRVAADDTVKGVILRIDSPGGDAIASEEILHDLKLLSKKKPMVISMSDTAASGGYYMAMTGDPVVAYPATFTGSIGVIWGKVNLRGLYDKLGIRSEVLTRGRNADIDSALKPLDPQARQKLKEGINETYETFLARVAEGRKKSRTEIAAVAEGRVWLGSQAKPAGLVDEVGGFDRAVELMKQRLKIDVKDRLRMRIYPRKKSLFEYVFGSPEDALERAAARRLRQSLPRIPLLREMSADLWSAGGFLARAPYSITID
ncbi:MAG: signal peptide peptidase SppA [Acidobacteria bacterium]|nr:signal peptide peptidase SppA [Acidobacteriota bacterium]